MTPVYTRVEAKPDNNKKKNTAMKGRRGDGIGLVLVVVYETKLSSSKCWLKPTRPWATSPKTSASKPRPGQVWPDKRPPVPTCDSYSCCSQLLVALVRHNVRVPAPPSIRQTAALIMLFFLFYFWLSSRFHSQRPLELVTNDQ